jgi:protein-L-isoaspartate(D-aspartate) O-methyltransferase
MVESQIVNRGITDEHIVRAFHRVPRDCFVPEQWRELSYKDHPLSIGNNQTISQPFMVATMMAHLDLKETDIVLEIGTGCGYLTALLAEIVKEVYTIERIKELMDGAKNILKSLGYTNIHYKVGDGSIGWVNTLPLISDFNKIIVSAGSPDVPESLITQLSNNGRLAIPIGSSHLQELNIYEKNDGKINVYKAGGCRFVPLIGKEGWEN